MNIQFGQIYVELNTSFKLSGILLGFLMEEIDNLGKEIQQFKDIFKISDFKLVFIISATRNKNTLEVKGPTIVRRNSSVEFVLYIPHKEILDFNAKVEYVLPYIAEGIVFVLNKYNTDSKGIEETVQEVIQAIHENPAAYQYQTNKKV